MGQKLTERQQVTTSDNNDLIHVVRNNQSYQMKADLIGSTIINESSSGNWVKGGINWSGTGLTYNVWVNECAINSTVYNTLVSSQVTLSDGDATNPRIDKFVIEVNAFASPPTFEIKAVEGTPAASPVEPNINLVNQAEIGFRITAANETTDPVTQLETIYDENTGESAEWDNDSVPSGSNLDYATLPYQGTKSLYVPKVESEVAQWTNDSLLTYNGEDSLVFALRADLSTSAEFQVKLINTSNGFYFLKTLKYSDLNKFGGKTSEVNWQLIQVKLSEFAPNSKSNTQYDSIEITFVKTPILSLDWLHIQSDLEQPSDPNRFTELSDTPNSYSGQAGKSISVKSDETGLEFGDVSGGGTELIDEGNGDGLVTSGRDPSNFGNVGLNAVDLSIGSGASSTRGATGLRAVALGFRAQASGEDSFAWGYDAKATGDYSFATVNSTASGLTSIAMGGTCIASSSRSIAMGFEAVASNSQAVSIGESTTATGQASTSLGVETFARSKGELSAGRYGTDTANRAFNFGNGTSTGARADIMTGLQTGLVTVPQQTIALIDTDIKAVVTKEYGDDNYKLKAYTVGTLPSGTIGDEAYVTDALTPSYLTTAVGGGAVVCKVFFNGANWIT